MVSFGEQPDYEAQMAQRQTDADAMTDTELYAANYSNRSDYVNMTGARSPFKGGEMLWDQSLADIGTAGQDRYAGAVATEQDRYSSYLGQQQDTLDYLKGVAEGRISTGAQQQLQGGLDQSLKQQGGLLGSQRGGNMGALGGAVASAGMEASMDVNAQQATLRAQEEAGAQELLNRSLSQLQAMSTGREQFYTGLGRAIDEADAARRLQLAEMQAQTALGNATQGAGNPAIVSDYVSGALQGLGSIAEAAVTLA